MFGRMKTIMESHVGTARNTMFTQACDSVKGQLDTMCAENDQLLTAFVEDLLTKMRRDYLSTLAGGSGGASAETPLAERMLHGQLRPILEDADSRFAEFCSSLRHTMPVSAAGAGREEDSTARQQEDGAGSDTEARVKLEPS